MILAGPPSRSAEFVTLFRMPWGPDASEDATFTRVYCLLAETIFSIMIGAHSNRAGQDVRDACVYGNPEEIFTSYGACSHFCMLESQRNNVTFALPPKMSRNRRPPFSIGGRIRWRFLTKVQTLMKTHDDRDLHPPGAKDAIGRESSKGSGMRHFREVKAITYNERPR